jgi:hypothetical protein
VFWIAFQLGTRLSAIGQHYESINEFVMAAGTMPHLRRCWGAACHGAVLNLIPRSALVPPSVPKSVTERAARDYEFRNASLLPTHASGAIIVVTDLSHEGGAA